MDRLVSAAALPMPLREDLRLHEAAPEGDGSPAWSIQDPLSNRFYRIGWFEFECLLRLPETRAVVFSIHTTIVHVDDVPADALAAFKALHP